MVIQDQRYRIIMAIIERSKLIKTKIDLNDSQNYFVS